jgi:hypothetical protein
VEPPPVGSFAVPTVGVVGLDPAPEVVGELLVGRRRGDVDEVGFVEAQRDVDAVVVDRGDPGHHVAVDPALRQRLLGRGERGQRPGVAHLAPGAPGLDPPDDPQPRRGRPSPLGPSDPPGVERAGRPGAHRVELGPHPLHPEHLLTDLAIGQRTVLETQQPVQRGLGRLEAAGQIGISSENRTGHLPRTLRTGCDI